MLGKRFASAYMSDHAAERCAQREINPFLVKLCHTYGRQVARGTKVLSLSDIPEALLKSFKHSLRNRIEHQVPVVGIFDDHGESYTVVTAFRASDGRRIHKEPSRDTYMSKLCKPSGPVLPPGERAASADHMHCVRKDDRWKKM